MYIPILKSKAKPDDTSAGLTIFDVEGEEFIFCPVRKKAYKVNSKPEEKVRFWWLYRLKNEYGYPFDQLDVEVSVKVGSPFRTASEYAKALGLKTGKTPKRF